MIDALTTTAAEGEPRRSHIFGHRVLGALWALFFGLLLAIEIQDHWNNPYIEWWEPFVWMSTSALAATIWLWLHLRDSGRTRDLDRPLRWFGRQLRWFPLIAIVFVVVVYALRHGVYYLLGKQYEHEPWAFVLVYESIKLWLFLGLWLGILFGFESFSHAQQQQRRLVMLQKSLAEANLQQLKAQLRPHFLFNALNTISSLMQVDVPRADRMLRQLADLLRASLRADREELTSLANELEILRLYAQIMEQRFEDRVTIEWSIAPDVSGALVPTMLLQPLLENAFKHGVERATDRTHIEIKAHRDGESLFLRITNDGTQSSTPGEGVGLRNCRARLQAHYGERARLSFSAANGRAEVEVSIPWQENTP